MYRSPIPFMGKQKLVRVCNYCIYCYSNCEFSQIKNFTYVPESQSRDRNSYSEFAESRCCKDLYVCSYVYFLWLSLIDYSTQRKRTRFFPLLLLWRSTEWHLCGFLTAFRLNVLGANRTSVFSGEGIIAGFVAVYFATSVHYTESYLFFHSSTLGSEWVRLSCVFLQGSASLQRLQVSLRLSVYYVFWTITFFCIRNCLFLPSYRFCCLSQLREQVSASHFHLSWLRLVFLAVCMESYPEQAKFSLCVFVTQYDRPSRGAPSWNPRLQQPSHSRNRDALRHQCFPLALEVHGRHCGFPECGKCPLFHAASNRTISLLLTTRSFYEQLRWESSAKRYARRTERWWKRWKSRKLWLLWSSICNLETVRWSGRFRLICSLIRSTPSRVKCSSLY